ncbi:conserved hypothetical protein [Formosa agariphila KMM 3901]|uniref:Lipoprotein n=1 Tax=Formosa agariphila (strain DSM 15362 / KCTC 12365 / LMG 23005 / KMM 3901 / M-2Alg 35-1) TaxID=1347342 RepID=T2KL70_FORAG|nr:hypothetical protein [Formosa agariphila]CDF79485.1 conserved hypothetical protein [Formosa agariphila KMM 3901]
MKKICVLFLIGILMSSCSDDDKECIDCALFDPAFPDLYIRLVDETGINIIENGTIDPKDITVEGNFSNPNFYYMPPNEYVEPDADIRVYDNTLLLYIPRASAFEYTLHLNDSTAIVLEFEADYTEIPCNISYYNTTQLIYNNQNIESELGASNTLTFLAEIEL